MAAAPAVRTRARGPNVIFILVDDHGHDYGSALGHPWLRTPHIDRLVRQGARFRNAFVTTSLCSPSRASILTGQYMHAHRVIDNFTPLDPAIPTFPRLLQNAGYRTAYIGKWHMGGESDQPRPGFDHWVSFLGQGQYTDPQFNVNGRRQPRTGYVTDLLTEEALRFLRAPQDRPWFLYLSHKAVHFDFVPAPRHRGLYASDPVPRPASMHPGEEEARRTPEWVRRRRASRQGVDGLYDHVTTFDDAYRNYCRSLAAVDESVGAVTAELEARGLAGNTVVLYMGDNGFMWGEHGLIDKRAMYEPSIRVPLLAWAPGMSSVPPGRTVERMALNLDIAPTILGLAGVPAPKSMHGRSLVPLLHGDAPGWRTDFLYEYEWEYDYPYTPTLCGLRTESHSYCQSIGLWDLDELYDLQADPEQRHNLLGGVRIVRERGRLTEQIRDPELRRQVDALQQRMARILAETGGDPRRSGRPPEGLRHAL